MFQELPDIVQDAAQINAVSNPQQKSQLQNILDIRKASITEGANIKARSTVLQNMTGDEINDILARDFGFTEPGFLGGDTPSQLIQMDKDTKFVSSYVGMDLLPNGNISASNYVGMTYEVSAKNGFLLSGRMSK